MKKYLFTFLCIFIFLGTTISETKWKIIQDSDLYKISWNGIDLENIHEVLHAGEVVTGKGSGIFENDSNHIKYVEIDHNGDFYVDLNCVKPLFSDVYLDEKYQTASLTKENKCLISVSYYEALKQKNRNYLCTLEKEGYKDYELNKTEFDYEWYDSLSYYNSSYIYDSVIDFSNIFSIYEFMVQKIEKNADGYLIKAEVTFSRENEKKGYRIPLKGDVIEFSLRNDGDYIFAEYQGYILGTYIISNKETSKQIDSFIRENTCDLSKVTWPRHSDGSCDYDGSKSTAKTPTATSSAAPSFPTTNVAVKKLMSTNCNLKLRAAEATSSNVLTVMAQGTKVKILELGKAETIDGISSNWVKVEVQKGAKDRDGKAIAPRTTGWCYGGYLE